MITQLQFSDLQEFFLIVFAPILQYLFVGIAAGFTGLLIVSIGLATSRRMIGGSPIDPPNSLKEGGDT
jgi:hypothetical protein